MKKIINKIGLILLGTNFLVASCTLDYVNPNAATEAQVFSTKDGLFALGIGIKQLYSTSALSSNLLTPSVTTRETAIMTTFANLEELENGGSSLSGENGYTARMFARNMRVKGMAEDLLAAVPNIDLEAGTSSALVAYGSLFRAMTLGNLAQNFEQVPVLNSKDGKAEFSDRMIAYQEAVDIMNSALAGLAANPESDDFTNFFGTDINLLNSLNAYVARYQLALGQYDLAIAAANKVNLSSVSIFKYDAENQNPVFTNMIFNVNYAPRDNFGLPAGLEPDAADERVGFYLAGAATPSDVNVLPVRSINAPFFTALDAEIPVYLPGEMMLIKAEAYARKNDLVNATTELNNVLQKQAATDAFSIGANLPAYSGGNTQSEILDAIYQNRRIELFLIGTSLEDSRRFRNMTPPAGLDFTTERNRNFYPYSEDERLNNPNIPTNPSI